MKNKLIIFVLILFMYEFNDLNSEEFKFESSEILILNDGNLVKATGKVKAISKDGLLIAGEETNYYKASSILKIKNNVVIEDKKKKIKIFANEVVYYRKKEIIKIYDQVTIEDNIKGIIINANEVIYNRNKDTFNISKDVKVKDNSENIIIEAQKINYDRKKEIIDLNKNIFIDDKSKNIKITAEQITYNKFKNIISSNNKATSNIENKYIIESKDLVFDREKEKIFSDKKTILKDDIGNTLNLSNLNFDLKKKILKGKNIQLFDNQNNKYFLKNNIVNLKTKEYLGNDVEIDFNNNIFGNADNDPRLKGKSVIYNENETTVYKGVFTTCKKRNGKCPPWAIYADTVKHKKKEKIIEYKNAWLEIYDKPVLYFPYFFHPDPTVKRQSGFLMPVMENSSLHGQSLQVPYYKVISNNKDLTLSPRVFFDDNILLQSEYRQVNKSSKAIVDTSINNDDGETKTHFFSNLIGKINNLNYEVNLENVTHDNYLKSYKIKSPLIKDTSSLNSFVRIEKFSDDNYIFDLSLEVFEDLGKNKSDRYEFVYPNYNYIKYLEFENLNGNLEFSSSGYQKNYNTNITELFNVNDLKFSSNSKILFNNFSNKYEYVIKNVNSNADNSKNFKSGSDQKLLGMINFVTKYPLFKEDDNYKSYLTPTVSFKLSPNKSKNYSDLDRRLNFQNIFSLDRLGKEDTVEGGQSLSLGFDYSKKSINDDDYFSFGMANVIRNKSDSDLPLKSSLNKKRSDVVGFLNFKPNTIFDINYNFSLDNKLDHSNYNMLTANLNVNNFITSFEYLEEDNHIGEDSYLSSSIMFDLNDNSILKFKTNKNLDKNITEYYNLIYEYRNDCLTAAIEYNKEFYDNASNQATDNLFFKIKIVPFATLNTPNIKN